MSKYDIAVIGAGSGGLVVALEGSRRGARVALLENRKVGGECTHYGCVPSKALLATSRVYQGMKEAPRLGLPQTAPAADFDFCKVMEHVASVVDGVYLGEQPKRLRSERLDVIVHPSGARFQDATHIAIGDDVLEADHVVIATGSSPRMPVVDDPDPRHFLNNENFWALRELPRSIVFLGGGVISVELGQALSRFGSQVTIIQRGPRILKAADQEVGALATELLTREGIRVFTDTEVVACDHLDADTIGVTVDQGGVRKVIETEAVFAAMGRLANTAGVDLEKAGVEYTGRGIVTNEYLQTSAPSIYACGDVTSAAKFTHVASHQARICLDNILEGKQRVNDLSIVPWAIFSEPEIAHVGLSEAEAHEKGLDVDVFRVGTDSVDRFICESKTTGFVKVVFDADERIVGADAIGAHAGEWIQFFTLAMKTGIEASRLGEMIFIYPTFSEIIQKSVTRFLRSKREAR